MGACMMNKTMVEAFSEGMTCGEALEMAHNRGWTELEQLLLNAFGAFCRGDGKKMTYKSARLVWGELPLGVDVNTGRVAIPVGLPEEE